jgi:phosphoribosylglycinamide formyltransferase
VFVSGGGSNFKAVHAATVDGRINGRVVVRAPRTRPQL